MRAGYAPPTRVLHVYACGSVPLYTWDTRGHARQYCRASCPHSSRSKSKSNADPLFCYNSIFEGTPESASPWHETDCAGQANLATPTSREQDPGIDASPSGGSSRKRSSNASLEAAAANRRRIDNDAIKAFAHTNSGSASAGTENAGTFKVYRPQLHRQLPVASDNLEPYPWIETTSEDDIIEL